MPAHLFHRFATVDAGIVEQNDTRHRMGLVGDAVKKGDHVVAHSTLLLERPQQLAIMAQRTQDVDTLPVRTGLGTTSLTDLRLSILQWRVGTEARLVKIQQIALPRLRLALQRRHDPAGTFERGGIALVLQAQTATLVAKPHVLQILLDAVAAERYMFGALPLALQRPGGVARSSSDSFGGRRAGLRTSRSGRIDPNAGVSSQQC